MYSSQHVPILCSQSLQKGKADEFEDEEAAAKIMATTNTSKMYSIGQTIKGFEARRQSQVCDSIMLRGLKEKFCDPKLKKFLLKTGDRHIVKCNGKDMYWRTGIYLDDPKSLNRNA